MSDQAKKRSYKTEYFSLWEKYELKCEEIATLNERIRQLEFTRDSLESVLKASNPKAYSS